MLYMNYLIVFNIHELLSVYYRKKCITICVYIIYNINPRAPCCNKFEEGCLLSHYSICPLLHLSHQSCLFCSNKEKGEILMEGMC
jgi:hypothetical protein